MDEEGDQYLIVINMTSYFNRPMFMYSLGDIRFSRPIALKKLAYIMGAMLIWTLPLLLIFGLIFNPFFLAIALAPPFFIGNWMSKPSFGGMSFINFLKVCFRFISEPKGWADLYGTEEIEETDYYVRHETWISRRRELHYLADIAEQRHESGYYDEDSVDEYDDEDSADNPSERFDYAASEEFDPEESKV